MVALLKPVLAPLKPVLAPGLRQQTNPLPLRNVNSPRSGMTSGRVDRLRSLLLRRELQSGPQAAAPSIPAIILGQWRN